MLRNDKLPLRQIKKYDNRKLYDLSQGKYVTLESLADILLAGHEIRVIDNKSQENITAHILLQVIFDLEKKKLNSEGQQGASTQLLHQLFKNGDGTFSYFIKIMERLLDYEKQKNQKDTTIDSNRTLN